MAVRPPVEVAHAVGGNVATLTADVPVGWDLIVVGTAELEGGTYLDAGGCTDSQGNPYHSDGGIAFHVSAGNMQGNWDPAFRTDLTEIGDAGYLGGFCYSTRVVNPLVAGDTITVPRATHLGALKTKGLQLAMSSPYHFGSSGGEGTLSDGSDPQREWSIGFPFGTTGVPPIPMQSGDLLIGLGVFRFPFEGTADPDYTVELPPSWHLHANWLGQAPGAAAPDGMILTSLRARTAGLYDFRGSIGSTAEALYTALVLGFRGTGPLGSGPSSVHSQHGRYVAATEESSRIRIWRAPGPVPPFEYNALIGPEGCSAPRLAWNPRRDVLQLLYTAPDGSAELIASNDSGTTWSDPVTVFTEGVIGDHKIDDHGFGVCAVFTELNPATGVGSIQVARQGIADAAPSLPFNIKDATGADLFFEPTGFTLSPANDSLERWLLTATAEGDNVVSQWYSTDRCLTFSPTA